MHTNLLFPAILICTSTFSQIKPVYLHLQKNGIVKKKFEAGSEIRLFDKQGYVHNGFIRYMKTDSIILHTGDAVAVTDVYKFRIPHKKKRVQINKDQLPWITLGVGLCTVGMALSKWETWGGALKASAVIGYSPYLFQKLKSISFKKYTYKIGRKYRLRVWDLN